MITPRPLPELIMTDRPEPVTPVWSGKEIDWMDWDTYLAELVCRCAKKAAEKKYSVFGVQHFGMSF